MKKLIICALLGVLLLPVQSFASEKMGIYIAPKLSLSSIASEGKMNYDSGYMSRHDYSQGEFGGALAIGYDFSPKFNLNLRTEIEYGINGKSNNTTLYTDFEASDDTLIIAEELSVSTLFLNIYYDFKNSSNFTPYLGAGLGIAFVGIEGSAPYEPKAAGKSFGKSTESNFAWNIGLGVAYDINDTFSIDLGYRYASFGDVTSKVMDIDSSTLSAKSLDAHQIMLGVRFTF